MVLFLISLQLLWILWSDRSPVLEAIRNGDCSATATFLNTYGLHLKIAICGSWQEFTVAYDLTLILYRQAAGCATGKEMACFGFLRDLVCIKRLGEFCCPTLSPPFVQAVVGFSDIEYWEILRWHDIRLGGFSIVPIIRVYEKTPGSWKFMAVLTLAYKEKTQWKLPISWWIESVWAICNHEVWASRPPGQDIGY